MPGYKAHLTVGSLTYAATLIALSLLPQGVSLEHAIIGLPLSLIGSIFPDIDIHSTMQKIFFRSTLIVFPLFMFLQKWHLFFTLGFITLLIPTLRHRTLTHNIGFLIIAPGSLILYYTYQDQTYFQPALTFSLFFITGAMSHVLLDRIVTKIRPRRKKR